MQKFLTIISIVLLFLFVAPTRSNAQVVTEIDSISVCYHAFKSVPVVVQNMTAVDSLRLNLTFKGDKVECAEYFGVHEALAAGNFVTTIYDDSVVITWSAKTSVTLPNDTLVSLRFKGLADTSILGWNTSSSFYHTSTGNLPVVFLD